jgi:arylsulfatase
MLVRWPAKIAPGQISNGIQTHEDLFTTLASAAGVKDVVQRLNQTHKVCIDGVNNLAHWTENRPSARNTVYYYNESQFTAVRVGPWKAHLQTREGFFDSFKQSSLVFNLRMDPFEQHDGQKSNDLAMRMGVAFGGLVRDAVQSHMASFQACPIRQKGGTLRMSTPK